MAAADPTIVSQAWRPPSGMRIGVGRSPGVRLLMGSFLEISTKFTDVDDGVVAVGKVRMSRPWSDGEVLVDFSSSCPVDRGYFVLFIVTRMI